MRNTTETFLILPFLLCLIPWHFACNSTQQIRSPYFSNETITEAPNKTSHNKLTTEVDRELFRQIKGLGDIFAENTIWRGYDYRSYGQYLVHITPEGPDRAFLINPQQLPAGAIKLGENENQGLASVYRYDLNMQEAYDYLFGPQGNEVFTFDFQIQGSGYYLQAYTDDLSAGMQDPSMTVSYSTHELFHRFQDEWEWVPEAQQDFDNFPLTSELLELQILCQEVLQNLPDAELDKNQLRNLLLQYVAIRSRELAIDPTSKKLIRNHELYQEQMEGSARFIETMSNRQFFSSDQYEARFGFSLLEFWAGSKEDVRSLVGQSVYYGTGGSAIYLLYRLGYPIEQMQLGKTPFDLAMDYLRPTSSEMEAALQQAYANPKMADIRKKVREWMAF